MPIVYQPTLTSLDSRVPTTTGDTRVSGDTVRYRLRDLGTRYDARMTPAAIAAATAWTAAKTIAHNAADAAAIKCYAAAVPGAPPAPIPFDGGDPTAILARIADARRVVRSEALRALMASHDLHVRRAYDTIPRELGAVMDSVHEQVGDPRIPAGILTRANRGESLLSLAREAGVTTRELEAALVWRTRHVEIAPSVPKLEAELTAAIADGVEWLAWEAWSV